MAKIMLELRSVKGLRENYMIMMEEVKGIREQGKRVMKRV